MVKFVLNILNTLTISFKCDELREADKSFEDIINGHIRCCEEFKKLVINSLLGLPKKAKDLIDNNMGLFTFEDDRDRKDRIWISRTKQGDDRPPELIKKIPIWATTHILHRIDRIQKFNEREEVTSWLRSIGFKDTDIIKLDLLLILSLVKNTASEN